MYRRSLLNSEAPTATPQFEPVNGQTPYEIIAQRLTDFAFPDTQAEKVTLGGQPAVMLDNLPGQYINRLFAAVHDGLVYDLVIYRIGPDYGAVGDQAEALYQMIMVAPCRQRHWPCGSGIGRVRQPRRRIGAFASGHGAYH